jgi:hypothetical protein
MPAICTEEVITLGAELEDGTVIRGQNNISHPSTGHGGSDGGGVSRRARVCVVVVVVVAGGAESGGCDRETLRAPLPPPASRVVSPVCPPPLSATRAPHPLSHPLAHHTAAPSAVDKSGVWQSLPSPVRRVFYLSREGTGREHEVAPAPNPAVLQVRVCFVCVCVRVLCVCLCACVLVCLWACGWRGRCCTRAQACSRSWPHTHVPSHTPHVRQWCSQAVQGCDAVLYGMGSLYTSICPALILDGVGEAIAARQDVPKVRGDASCVACAVCAVCAVCVCVRVCALGLRVCVRMRGCVQALVGVAWH